MSRTLLLLLVGLPPSPSSLRVRVWRRLRALGAIALKRSAYLLPDTPERYEDFQWLAQEIQRDGGEATLIRVQQIENVSSDDVARMFHEPRDHDYSSSPPLPANSRESRSEVTCQARAYRRSSRDRAPSRYERSSRRPESLRRCRVVMALDAPHHSPSPVRPRGRRQLSRRWPSR